MVSELVITFKLVVLLSACLGASALPTGKVLNVSEGERFEISCQVMTPFGPGSSWRTVTFLKDGQPVELSNRATVFDNSHLRIVPVVMSDAGVYSCNIGDKTKVVGTVVVRPKPTGKALLVNEGEGFEISCQAEASDELREEVTFLKDDQPFQLWNRATISEGSRLTMSSAVMSDSGVYTCKVGDEVKAERSVIVRRVLNVKEGTGFGMTCQAIPSHDVTFFKDGRPVQLSNRATVSEGNRLTIGSVAMSDAGVYTCMSGDIVDVVGTVVVRPDTGDSDALGITFAIVAFVILIIGAIVYCQRCKSWAARFPPARSCVSTANSREAAT